MLLRYIDNVGKKSCVQNANYLIANVKEKVKETTEVVSMLDEKDLGLMEDMNEIIWGDVEKV